MKRLPLVLALVLSVSHAQVVIPAPKVTVGLPPEPATTLATSVVVQPSRLEARLAPGVATAVLNFSLFSSVDTQVFLKSNDARLALRFDAKTPVRLRANTAQPTSVVVTAPHSGTLTVLNSQGVVLTLVPYTVAAAKVVNQSLNLNYAPASSRVNLAYSISGANPSVLDPQWGASMNLGVNTNTGQVSGSVSFNVSW